jgi:cytochrome c oxidase assembly protein subunit 11
MSAPMTSTVAARRANTRALWLLVCGSLIILFFFLFGFRSLYRLWCSVTGTGLNPNNVAVTQAPAVATGRYLSVHFESKIFDDLPVLFWAEKSTDRIEVGGDARNTYYLRNLSDQPVHLRPVHQVAPFHASPHFAMRVCFCFQDQIIGPHEEKSFPVIYRFAPALDERVNDIALCYSVFNIVGAPSAALLEAEKKAKEAIIAEPENP